MTIFLFIVLVIAVAFTFPISRNFILKITGLSADFNSLVTKVEAEGEALIAKAETAEKTDKEVFKAKVFSLVQRLETLAAKLRALLAKL